VYLRACVQVDDIVAPFSHDNAGGKIGPTLARHDERLPEALREGKVISTLNPKP
jgi:hypothetical protein